MYDPLAGRFMTADPVTQAPFWSQGLNRYSYVFNNPINNTDPSGFSAAGADYSGVAITGWAAGVTGIAALSGVGAGAIAGGAGIGGLNVATSFATGAYGMFDAKAGGTYTGTAPTTAPKGTGLNQHGGAGATVNNRGGPTELARPSGTSLFDPARGAVAQNFQRGGYCHEDGPCHDSIYIPDISGGDFARAGSAIANWFQRLWRSLTPAARAGAEATKLTIQFGKGANQVSHAFRHVDAIGLERAAVQSAVEKHLPTVVSQLQPGKPLNQIIEVAGQRLQYTAYLLKEGIINVGRIHPVP